jgi:predicted HD phosphohydrolase
MSGLVDKVVYQVCDDVESQYYESIKHLIWELLTDRKGRTNEELLIDFLKPFDDKDYPEKRKTGEE